MSIVEAPGVSLTIIEQSEFAIANLPSGYIYRFDAVPFEPGSQPWHVAAGDLNQVELLRRRPSSPSADPNSQAVAGTGTTVDVNELI